MDYAFKEMKITYNFTQQAINKFIGEAKKKTNETLEPFEREYLIETSMWYNNIINLMEVELIK